MAKGFEVLLQDPVFALGYGLLASPQNPIQGAMGVLQSGAQIARQTNADAMQEKLMQMQLDTQKNNQEYRDSMLELQKQKMQMPQIQPMFNPVTGEPMGYDRRTGVLSPLPIAGGASMSGQMGMGGMDAAGMPPEIIGNPKAEQVGVEAYAKEKGKMAALAPQKEAGQKRFSQTINDLRNYYADLKKSGGAVSTGQGALENLQNYVARSGIGQFFGDMSGNENATIARNIKSAAPILLQSIMQATGMSAKALDSNTELKLYLSALGDPTNSYETNLEILDRIENMFGSGDFQKMANQPQVGSATQPQQGNVMQPNAQQAPVSGGQQAVPNAGQVQHDINAIRAAIARKRRKQ